MKTTKKPRHVFGIMALTLTGAFMSSVLASNAGAQPYPSGMISYWTFDDGTAKDVLGNNNGVIVGSPAVVAGKVGGALRFDGIDDGIIVPNSPSLNPTNITLEAWVQYLSYHTDWFSRRNMIFDKRVEGYGSYNLDYNGYRDPGNTGGWESDLNIDGTWHTYIQGLTSQIPTSTWYHVVETFDGSFVKLYENGLLVKTWAQSGAISSTTTDLYLAKPGHHLDSYSNAVLDEVAIYNRALTFEEIQQHYQNGLNGIGYQLYMTINIDIKPGSASNPVNLGAGGSIPVAILSSPTFDATTVDQSTVKFADAAANTNEVLPQDVNGDGLLDMVFHFKIADVSLSVDDDTACLTGVTLSGIKFEGCDNVRVLR